MDEPAPMDTRADSESHTPQVILSDEDKALFSKNTYAEAAALPHLDVICELKGQEVRRWRVSEVVSADPSTQTFEVRLKEWPRVVVRVPPERLHKHVSSLSV